MHQVRLHERRHAQAKGQDIPCGDATAFPNHESPAAEARYRGDSFPESRAGGAGRRGGAVRHAAAESLSPVTAGAMAGRFMRAKALRPNRVASLRFVPLTALSAEIPYLV